MGVHEILMEFLQDEDPVIKSLLADVIVAEQHKIDMQRARGIKEEIKNFIDAQVRLEERDR